MPHDFVFGSVTEHLVEGFDILRKAEGLPEAFGMSSAQWNCIDKTTLIDEFIKRIPLRHQSNPDVFYTELYIGLAHEFQSTVEISKDNIQQLTAKEYPTDIFSATHIKFKNNDVLLDEFRRQCDIFCPMLDEELKFNARSLFQVSYLSLLTTAESRNFIFTKINHGYWEHFLSNYASAFETRSANGEFRSLEIKAFESRYSTSGMDAALALLIRDTLSKNTLKCGNDSEGITRLAISHSAGERIFSETLNRPLSPVSRAAMSGSLAFFNSIIRSSPISLGDGSEAKKLIDDRELITFAEKFINDAPAVLFVVPPHLKDIVVPGMTGQIYKMIVPRKFAHETWRLTLPVFLSLVQRLISKHGKVVILTQSAVLAPILGLSLPKILNNQKDDISIRFFDLGRVLDVALPEISTLQHWFKPYAHIPLEELCPFRLGDIQTEPHLLYEGQVS